MRGNESTIEADVVEIDGVAVEPRDLREETSKGAPWEGWGAFGGKVKRLDTRWWPLWLVLGVVALVVIVSVGMVAVVAVAGFRIVAGLVNGIADLFAPSHGFPRR